jgi:CBS domain-containing protein
MHRTGNGRLLVTEHGALVGIVTLKDMLKFLSIKLDLETGEEPGLRSRALRTDLLSDRR